MANASVPPQKVRDCHKIIPNKGQQLMYLTKTLSTKLLFYGMNRGLTPEIGVVFCHNKQRSF